MNTPLPTLHGNLPAVCRLLRTKNAYGNYESAGQSPWQSGQSTTAVYWCLATMGTAGPDERLVHPHNCAHGRGCFKPR